MSLGSLTMLSLAGLALLVTGIAFAGPPLAGEPEVIDGDGLRVLGESIRLWGIDVPERESAQWKDLS